MKHKRITLFSNNTPKNWKNLILCALVVFNFSLFSGDSLKYGAIRGDYLAFWGAGKIADEQGYSQIYDLNNLKSVQFRELEKLGVISKTGDSSVTANPVPYFSFFVIPFQLFSRVNLVQSYWMWTFLNLIVLVGYLLFLQKKLVRYETDVNHLNLLILMLISYPVLINIYNGQVDVFLVVFSGEFMRNALSKKPFPSGLWLGGLLLKPQLLILIIPVILIMRYWKVLLGFILSSGIIMITSFLLSGISGMKALFNLLIKYSGGITSSAPESMINWRMVGLNLNNLLNTSLGWVITGLGMVLTVLAVYFLIRHKPPYGSSQWITTILGVFSATLAVTWHSHYHMAMVIIPFLIYASMYKQLPEKIIFLWGIVTPIIRFAMLIIALLVIVFTKINITDNEGWIIAFSGFILNLVILISSMQYTKYHRLKQYKIPE